MNKSQSDTPTTKAQETLSWLREAVAHHIAGRIKNAETMYLRVLEWDPDSLDGNTNFAILEQERGNLDRALELSEKALAVRSDHAPAHNIRAMTLAAMGRLAEADDAYRAAIRANGSLAEPHANHANLLRRMGRPAEAVLKAEQAIALRPDFAEAFNQLGNARFDLGEMNGAEAAYRSTLKHNPGHVMARHNLALSKIHSRQDPDLRSLRDAATQAERQGAGPEIQSWLRFGLVKALDDAGNFDEAYAEAEAANALMRGREPFDLDGHGRLLGAIQQASMIPSARRGDTRFIMKPLFVLGVSRSGKGMLQRVLSGIGNSLCLDEGLPWRPVALEALAGERSTPDSKLVLRTTHPDEIARQGNIYRNQVSARAPGTELAISATPGNLIYVGTIAAALPEGRFVYVRRNERDLCLRIFFKRYVAGNGYAYSLPEILRFVRQYDGLMGHWASLLGERLIEISYEDLIVDPDSVLTRLMDHLGISQMAIHDRPNFSDREIGAWKNYAVSLERDAEFGI